MGEFGLRRTDREQGLDADADELYRVASDLLEPAIAVDPTYADARAFRAVVSPPAIPLRSSPIRMQSA